MSNKAEGFRLAEGLASSNPVIVRHAQNALRTAPPSVTNAAAKQLAKILKGGGSPALAVCTSLSDENLPRFGGRSWQRVFTALAKIQGGNSNLSRAAQKASVNFLQYGQDSNYIPKLEAEVPPLSEDLMARILSVAKRIWVWVTYPMLCILFIVISPFSSPIVIVAVCLGIAALLVCIDAYLRKCPNCKMLLAGQLLSIVQDGSYQRTVPIANSNSYGTETVNTHKRKWRCVSCKHEWIT